MPLLVALSLGGVVAVACGNSGSSSVVQGGDDIINDTRDSSVRAPPNPDDGATPSGQPEGGYSEDGSLSYYSDDGPSVTYPGVAECSSCSCPATKSYCFGGATPRKDPMIMSPSATDAGPPCPVVAAGTLGCTALPAGATNCADLLAVLQPTYACYLVCAYDGTTMTVYCPNP